MKMNMYEYPKSSFLGMSKDTSLIVDKILSNQNVLKLLYYNTPDCLQSDNRVSSGQIKEMFDSKQISIVPKVEVDKEEKTYLRIMFNSFVPNESNPYYRDHLVEIKIICHFNSWTLNNFELRPYRIAGEIDSMLDGQHLTGIGELQFISATQNVYDEEFGGITLTYLAIRGNEDKVNPLQ